MIIEYAQLMSTAHRYLDGTEWTDRTKNNRKIKRWRLDSNLEHVLYKASHINHPSGIWVRKNKENYMWLYRMWTELNTEFMYRYNKNDPHESYRKLHKVLATPPTNIADGKFTQPTPAMPDDVKDLCSIVSYKQYYVTYKQHLAKWTKRGAPKWYKIA